MTGRNDETADGSIPDTRLTREEFAECLAIQTEERFARLSLAERTERLTAMKQLVAGARAEQAQAPER